MMHHDLTVPSILERAGKYFPRKQVVTRVPGGVHRMSYEKLRQRTCQLANVLEGLGVRSGDRVATFAWNTHRHMEVYWAAPSMGAVAHTVNIRLAPDDLIHIINHAGDQVLLIDEDLVPIVEAVADKLQTVEHYIVMSDESTVSTNLRAAQSYESLMERASTSFKSPILDEHSPAGLCYTSATTGRPKGVMYSHRAIYLHTMMQCMTDFIGLSERDVVLAVVPMFHANCWGVPFSSAMVGADQVLPGVRPDPQAICELIESERVTVALGVPTIWVGVLDHVQRSTRKYGLSSLRLFERAGFGRAPGGIESERVTVALGNQCLGVSSTTAATSGWVSSGPRAEVDRCMDNVFVERLWRSIKYEEVYLKAYQNGTEARKGIGAYLAFYNQERPHQALG